MNTISFDQLIDHLIKKGADIVTIVRSNRFCGCIKPGDIIEIEVSKNGYTFVASVSHVFDSPVIDVDRIVRDVTGRCTARWTIRQFSYSK